MNLLLVKKRKAVKEVTNNLLTKSRVDCLLIKVDATKNYV